MVSVSNSRTQNAHSPRKGRILVGLLFMIGLTLIGFAFWGLWSGFQEDAAARAEYTALREMIDFHLPSGRDDAGSDTEGTEADDRLDMRSFFDLNPDFAGWIFIPGTEINYPIARGADNERYLHTTFSGEQNVAGAIFMDYRATRGFETPLTIIHGHNMRDGSMFASLHRYLDPDFLESNRDLSIITETGERLTYHIFDVRLVSAWDSIYALNFLDADAVAAHFAPTAPIGTGRFLALSTCASGDRRLLVMAGLPEL